MNLRASAIVMKSLPATVWGDALLISREEARRIGYELEQAAERIEALEARATPALPNVERKCSECGNGEPDLSLYCVRCLNNDGWHQAPEGMAIVPQELPQGVEEWIAEHGLQYVDTLGGYGVKLKRSSELKYPCPEYVSVDDLRSYLSGMAIVPVERLTVEWANKNVVVPPEVKGRVMSEMFWRGVYAMLAAAKEKQS